MPQVGRFRNIPERAVLRTINPQSLDGLIEVPANTTYIVSLSLASPLRVTSLAVKTTAGTLTLNARIGAVSIAGLSAIAVSNVLAEALATGANGTDYAEAGDTLDFVVTANAGGANLNFSFKYAEQ